MLFIYNQAYLQPGDLLLWSCGSFLFVFHMQKYFKIPKKFFIPFSQIGVNTSQYLQPRMHAFGWFFTKILDTAPVGAVKFSFTLNVRLKL